MTDIDIATTTWNSTEENVRTRVYVVDTSVLLSDPNALLRFAEHSVVLPVVVITELEAKRHHPELGYFARAALRLLDDLRVMHGRLDSPIPVNSDGGTLKVELNHTDPMVLPAGFLQPTAFGLEQSDAANYGAIGTSIAHDLIHGIDLGGSELDVHGRPRPWWTEADRREFQTRAGCISEQFEGYFIEPGLHHRGPLVLSEAIGDLTGVRLALLAFRKVSERHPVPVGDGFTPEQQFFIAFGQARGDAVRLEAQRELVATDPHPVPKFRVIGTLSNLPEFQSAFACRTGAAMVRPPEKRCAVW